MLVQLFPLQDQLDLIVMRVEPVLSSPVATDEVVLGDEIPLYSNLLHGQLLP